MLEAPDRDGEQSGPSAAVPPARKMEPGRRGQTLAAVVRHNGHAGEDCGDETCSISRMRTSQSDARQPASALLSTTRQIRAVRPCIILIARNERQLPEVPRTLARGTVFVVGNDASPLLSTRWSSLAHRCSCGAFLRCGQSRSLHDEVLMTSDCGGSFLAMGMHVHREQAAFDLS
jgi:hypothetical protein